MLVMALKLVLFLIEDLQVNGQTRLYSSGVHSISSKTFDCLYGYIVEGGKEVGKPFIQSSNLIPYCRRLADNEEEGINSPTNENVAKRMSFKELKEKKISSEDLVEWFISIDLAEDYQMNSIDESKIFYNCSSPWFGSHCQYRWIDNSSQSVADRINAHFVLIGEKYAMENSIVSMVLMETNVINWN